MAFPQTPVSLRFPELPKDYSPLDPWKSDLAKPDREDLAKAIYAYLQEKKDQTGVIAIHAPWGSGKSLFFRMWQDSLLNQGKPCLYFNAWKYDYLSSPIAAFLLALERQIEEFQEKLPVLSEEPQEAARRTIYQHVIDARECVDDMVLKAWVYGPQAIAKYVPILGKGGAMAGMAGIGADPAATVTAGEIAQQALTDLFTPSDEDKRKAFRATLDSMRQMEEFQTALHEFARRIAPDQPLIVLVDELDRCRPDFAIALLEEIKHLFGVQGVFFVLAVEKNQLANCIRSRYGLTDSGAMLYLDKFIDYSLELPLPHLDKFLDSLNTHVRICSIRGYTNAVCGIITEFFPQMGLRRLAHIMSALGFVSAQQTKEAEIIAATIVSLFMHDKCLDEALAQIRAHGDSYLSKPGGNLTLEQKEHPKQLIYITCRYFWPDHYRASMTANIGSFNYGPEVEWKQFDADQFRDRVCRLLQLTGNSRTYVPGQGFV